MPEGTVIGVGIVCFATAFCCIESYMRGDVCPSGSDLYSGMEGSACDRSDVPISSGLSPKSSGGGGGRGRRGATVCSVVVVRGSECFTP